jgi:hypothetical protein
VQNESSFARQQHNDHIVKASILPITGNRSQK